MICKGQTLLCTIFLAQYQEPFKFCIFGGSIFQINILNIFLDSDLFNTKNKTREKRLRKEKWYFVIKIVLTYCKKKLFLR